VSWFEYGSFEGKDRKLRKGVWLRTRSLPKELLDAIKKKMRMFERLERVVVDEIRPDGKVLLEFWSYNAFVDCFDDGAIRYTVSHVLTSENPKWVCEGDLGRGYKEPKGKG
jgi:hypothetical protein